MERRDFVKKLGIALGASSIPMGVLASTISDDVVSEDVLKEKIKVFYYSKAFNGWESSRYYLRKEDAYISWLLMSGIGGVYRFKGWNGVQYNFDVLSCIQGAAWMSKYCLPEYGGDNPTIHQDFNDSQILEKEVTFKEFLNHNSKVIHDRVIGTKQPESLKAKP